MGRTTHKSDHKAPSHDAHLPRLSYQQAKTAWFVSEGKAYALGLAPAGVFRAFVQHCTPKGRLPRKIGYDDCLRLLASRKIDLEARWFIVCSLLEAKIAVPLYASQQEAKKLE
jgi:hypothetical protein